MKYGHFRMGKNEHFVSFKDFIFFKLEENGEKLENFKLKMENYDLRYSFMNQIIHSLYG
tara:strand:+ start:355 stop:531 length:177 start_codon:yes stop_codon:yes gene_type:complete